MLGNDGCSVGFGVSIPHCLDYVFRAPRCAFKRGYQGLWLYIL